MRPGDIVFSKEKNDGKTVQSEKDNCDINKIMSRYNKTGRLPELIKQNPIWGDFSRSRELQDAFVIVEKAQLQFNALDADVRNEFENDPVKFLEFVENPANEKRLVEMGLAKEKPKPNEPVAPVEPAKKTDENPAEVKK